MPGGTLLKTSQLSPGTTARSTDIAVEVGASIKPRKAYFVDAINPNGNLGWALHRATVT